MKASPFQSNLAGDNPSELSPFQLEQHLQSHCLKKLDGDLLFGGCKPLAKLSDDEKRVIIQGFKDFTTSAVKRTLDELRRMQLI